MPGSATLLQTKQTTADGLSWGIHTHPFILRRYVVNTAHVICSFVDNRNYADTQAPLLHWGQLMHEMWCLIPLLCLWSVGYWCPFNNHQYGTHVFIVLLIKTYRKIFNIRRTKSQNLIVSRLVLQLSLPNPMKLVFSREWRCRWSSADRRCSNYIWVIDNAIAC